MGYRQDEFGELKADRPKPRPRHQAAPPQQQSVLMRIVWIALGLVWAAAYFKGYRF